MEDRFQCQIEPEPLPQRWAVLAIFSLATLLNANAWIMFAPISSIVQDQYNVSAFAVDSLSMVFMGVYIIFAVPALRVMETSGVRGGILVGSALTALGGWLRFFIKGYFGIIFGQTVISFGQLPLLGAPPLVSATWFGASEWAFATAIGVLANQAGGALAYLISPRAVTATGSELDQYLMYQASACTIVFILACFIPTKPPVPASHASAESQRGKAAGETSWGEFVYTTRADIASFLMSQSGALLSVSYGIAVGVFYTISTLLESIAAPLNAPGPTIGNAGFVMGVVGLVGSIAVGLFLDRTRLHKESLTGLLFLSAISMAGLSLADATKSVTLLYLAVGAIGFFLTGVLPAGFELAAEVSYPTPEDSVAVVLNISSQIFGIIFIAGASVLTLSPELVVWTLVVALFVGAMLSAMIQGEHRRQAAQDNALLVSDGDSPTLLPSTDGSTTTDENQQTRRSQENRPPLVLSDSEYVYGGIVNPLPLC